MKQLSLFDFDNEPTSVTPIVIQLDADDEWCVRNGISIYDNSLRTITEHSKCTGRSGKDIIDTFKKFGVDVSKTMSYARFNRICVNCGINYREQHMRAERDFELVKEIEDYPGHKLIRFSNHKYPVYCMGDHTFDGVKILEVVA